MHAAQDGDETASDARAAGPVGAVPLWSRGNRQPLLRETEAIDAEDLLREAEGALPEQPSASGGMGTGATLAGSASSHYAEDPVHGGFVRSFESVAPQADGDETLLTSRLAGTDGLARAISQAVVATLTIARGVLAGLALMHLFLLVPASLGMRDEPKPTTFVVYAPLALRMQSIFQALIGVSIVAVLDAHVMYSPSVPPNLTATVVVTGARSLVVHAGGSDGTRLIVALYATALLLGTLQTPIDHTLYWKYGVARLGLDARTGELNPEPDGIRSAGLVEWDSEGSCTYGLITCVAFTRERASLYQGLGIARDVLCFAAFIVASVFFAARPPVRAVDPFVRNQQQQLAMMRENSRMPAAALSPTGGMGV